jgi:hypothetical protein
MAFKTYLLTTEENGSKLYKAVISFANGDFTAAATTQSFTLFSFLANHVLDGIWRRNVTNLAITGSTSGTLIVGDDDDDDGFLVSKSVLDGATPIDTQTFDGAYGNQAGGKAYTAAKSLIAKFTTDATMAVTTAGEVHIFYRVRDLSKL